MKLKWSIFNIIESVRGGFLIKNTMTKATIKLSTRTFRYLDSCISMGNLENDSELVELTGENGILVDVEEDEISSFYKMFFDTRDNGTDTFGLLFLPTMTCQLSCNYCYENGIERKGFMNWDVVDKTLIWLDEYFSKRKLSRFKFILFGGEPLLGISKIKKALPLFSALAEKHGMTFCTEIVTNGELLVESTARFLHEYSWRRLQVSLDGPKDVHDKSRFGRNGRPTFDTIINNVLMVLKQKYIDKVDIRINFSPKTRNRVIELLEYLASLRVTEKLVLSFGIIMPTIGNFSRVPEEESAKAYIRFCAKAKELGFSIPTEYNDGPWCMATEKHSAVLQPNGMLQKCLSTVGRPQFDFSSVFSPPSGYPKDERFESFERTNLCRQEQCAYLPICGGGCPWEAIVESGEDDGCNKRFCRKTLLGKINRGLLRLNHL